MKPGTGYEACHSKVLEISQYWMTTVLLTMMHYAFAKIGSHFFAELLSVSFS